MSSVKSRQKRRVTVAGLGRVTGASPGTPPPISGPAVTARHTNAVESVPAAAVEAPTDVKRSRPRGLSSRPPRGRSAVSPVSVRIDDLGEAVTHVAPAVGISGLLVPKIVRARAEIAEAPIDHRAGFLLAHIDGQTNVQGLVDVAAMPEAEVHEILERLRRLGIVVIR